MKVKLIFGTDTGNTEYVIETYLLDLLNPYEVEVIELVNIDDEVWKDNDMFILGVPTWYDGVLQSDWEDYFDDFKKIDFTGKTVAIFGLGDQIGYSEFFVDGIGILAEEIIKNGGKIIGHWPSEDYDFDESKAVMNDDYLYGLAIDEDNEDDLTHYRFEKWVEKLKKEINSISTKTVKSQV
jgi:flavodoxin I